MNAEHPLAAFARKAAKDKFRFAVCGGRDEKHSGTWAAWAHNNSVYIGARSILGALKISLHDSGVCRVALTEPYKHLLSSQGLEIDKDRAFIKWKRKDTPLWGATPAVAIIFPIQFFRRAAPSGTPSKPLMILAAQPEWAAVEIGFYYSRELPAELESRFARLGTPLFWFTLDNGTYVSILARRRDFDPAFIPSDEMLDKAIKR